MNPPHTHTHTRVWVRTHLTGHGPKASGLMPNSSRCSARARPSTGSRATWRRAKQHTWRWWRWRRPGRLVSWWPKEAGEYGGLMINHTFPYGEHWRSPTNHTQCKRERRGARRGGEALEFNQHASHACFRKDEMRQQQRASSTAPKRHLIERQWVALLHIPKPRTAVAWACHVPCQVPAWTT